MRWLYAVEGLRPLTGGGREAVSAQVVNNDDGRKSLWDRAKNTQPIYTKGICFDSMRHQKMISLDGETLEIAETIENFSGWVRAQLHKYNEKENPRKRYSYSCDFCERVFTYDRDHGELTICRNKKCEKYGYEIGRYQE